MQKNQGKFCLKQVKNKKRRRNSMREFLSHFKNVIKSGENYTALCPAHNDHKNSLSIGLSKDRTKILINCFAGCLTEKILKNAGLQVSDLFIDTKGKNTMKITDKKRYDYLNEDGSLAYYKERIEYEDGSKSFAFYKPDGSKCVNGILRVPYNLPAVLKAKTIYFVEGEKCADVLISHGKVATTLDGGAKSAWRDNYNSYFKDKNIIIIPDNDKPGMEYAQNIKQKLPQAKIVELTDLSQKEDIFDWLKYGHTLEELDSLPETVLVESENIEERKMTQAVELINLLENMGMRLFHDEFGFSYIAITMDGHTEVWRIESEHMTKLLQKLYYQNTKRTIKREALFEVKGILCARASFDSDKDISVFNRVAQCDNAFWYDLSNYKWQAAQITEYGWKIVNNPPVFFQRYKHHKAQVMPMQNGDVRKIFNHINLKENHTLFLCWLISLFVPDIPHAVAIFYGEKGSAKSTTCEMLKKLIDPSALSTVSLPKDFRSMTITLQQHWFIAFDNISHISDEMSDTLCRAVTGAGIQQRKLCTDDEACIFNFQRCIALNGINNVASKADLLDRSVLFELQRISQENRKEQKEVRISFENDLPSILGGIFDILSKAIGIFPKVKLDSLPRMADFAHWGYAIGEALGGYGEKFLIEYKNNRKLQNAEAVNADIVGTLIVGFMKNQDKWSGLISELFMRLKQLAKDSGIRENSKEFPAKPNALSRRLNNLKSNLQEEGMRFTTKSTSKGTVITVYNENIPPLPSYPNFPNKRGDFSNGAIMKIVGKNDDIQELPPYENFRIKGDND